MFNNIQTTHLSIDPAAAGAGLPNVSSGGGLTKVLDQINLQTLNQNILLGVQAINALNKQLATWFVLP